MKSYLKSELAQAAGVSLSTFGRWMRKNEGTLNEMGVKPRAKMLPPKAVEWVCTHYGIAPPPL